MKCKKNNYFLEDITTLITDGKHGDCENKKDSGYYFLSVKDIIRDQLDYENARQIEKSDFEETDKRTNLQPGDILFTNTGTIGRMAIAPNHALTRKTTFQKSVAIIKPKHELIFPKYLFYLLKNEKKRICLYAEGTTQLNLLLKDLRSFHIGEIPELPYQKAISHILGTFDEKIDLNNKISKDLETIIHALFKSWFVDFLPVKAKSQGLSTGLPEDISNLFPDSFEDSELGGKPRGWRICHLDELLDLKKNLISPNENPHEIFDHYSIPAFDDGMEPTKDIGLTIDSNKFLMTENVFLVSKLNPNCPRVWLPSKTKTRRCIASTEFMVCQPKKEVGIPFAYCLIKSYKITQQMISMITGTSSSHQRLRPEDFRSITSVRPNDQLFEFFSNTVSSILEKLLLIREENNLLTEYQNVLLPKLISGQIKIPDAEKMLDEVGI